MKSAAASISSRAGFVEEMERRRLAGTVLDPGVERRWALSRKAGRIMRELVMREAGDGTQVRHLRYRVSLCHRGVGDGPLEILRSPDALRAEYRGLQTCGSVWLCPICSPKVAAERVREINHAMGLWTKGHKGKRGMITFGTFTYRHGRETAGAGMLAGRLAEFGEALSAVKGSRAYREILERVRMLGTIRGLETTYGELNGWHNHTHEIGLAGRGFNLELRELRRLYFTHCVNGRRLEPGRPRWVLSSIRQALRWCADRAVLHALRGIRKLWARELIKRGMAGLDANDTPTERRAKLRNLLARCYVIQPGAYAADYVSKFGKEPEQSRGRCGLASELARSHLKRGGPIAGNRDAGLPARCDHASPWQLLNDALDGDERSGMLFREFGEAFHGKRQLYWSKGLKEFFDIAALDDEAIAEKPDERCTQYVTMVTLTQWQSVIRHDARFAVLKIAAREGREAVLEFIDSLAAVTAAQEHPPPPRSP